MVPLSKRLKQLRAKRKLTQLKLAKKTGLTLAYIGRLETGYYDPKLSSLRRLAKVLGVTITELVEYKGEP
jgi:transcriptional regulator with XRE-family HTH domain